MADDDSLAGRRWVDAREAQRLWPVKDRWLRDQAAKGRIRSAKLNRTKQSRRLYAVPDIAALLDRLAEAELAMNQE